MSILNTGYLDFNAPFYTRDVLPVCMSFGKLFVLCLVMRLQYKDETRYPSRQASFGNASQKTNYER